VQVSALNAVSFLQRFEQARDVYVLFMFQGFVAALLNVITESNGEAQGLKPFRSRARAI
jgi:hypothetical protein